MRSPSDSDPRLAGRLSSLLLAGLSLAVLLFIVGMILKVAQPDVPFSAGSITELPRALAALEPRGYFDLGLLVLLATPAARVVALLIAFARQRLWVFSGASFVVLIVLALSAFLGLRGT